MCKRRQKHTMLFTVERGAFWAALVGAVLLGASAVSGGNFAWFNNGDTPSAGINPQLILRDDTVGAVDAALASQPVKTVRIDMSIAPQTIDAIFNKYKIDYTFMDFEGTNGAANAAATVSRIKASTSTGPALTTGKAYISNFGFSPAVSDPTSPGIAPSYRAYASCGLNTASPELYPGSPTYRNPASGNSTAPNIRSALFVLPIQRLTMTSAMLPAGNANVPYVNRFNNWGNSALDTDKDPSNGYEFATTNQLPSRGDFEAQILHYRLRGATAVHGLDGGVIGYTEQQFESDINNGWNSLSSVNQIFADPKARLATLDTRVRADGVLKNMEDVGVVWSGAYSLASGKLVLLLSNMDEAAHTISLANLIGGKTVTGNFDLSPGTHRLVEFGASGTNWTMVSDLPVFTDFERGGVGVPEPAGLATIAGAAMLLRRRRK